MGMRHHPEFWACFGIPLGSHWDSQGFFGMGAFPGMWTHLKKPLQPSQVMALKWKPVALSPQTPQILDTFRSESPLGSTREVLQAPGSMAGREGKKNLGFVTTVQDFSFNSTQFGAKLFWDNLVLKLSLKFRIFLGFPLIWARNFYSHWLWELKPLKKSKFWDSGMPGKLWDWERLIN